MSKKLISFTWICRSGLKLTGEDGVTFKGLYTY